MPTELKPLPRDKNGQVLSTFEANGTKYKILKATDALSIGRYTEFTRLSAVVGFGVDFSGLIEHLNDVQRKVLEIQPTDALSKKAAILKIESLIEKVIESSQERFAPSFYFCTLFIVTEDEDLTKWDFDEQSIKIADWNTEGYKPEDFFSLAALTIPNFIEVWQNMKEEASSRVIESLMA